MSLESLIELSARVPDHIRKDILSSAFVFPQTASLTNNVPLVDIDLSEHVFDLDRILMTIQQDVTCVALSIREDLDLVLRDMDSIKEEIPFHKFDTIQVYRGGMAVLSITFTTNHCGRSVCLEINDYRRRLHQLLVPSASKQIITTAICTTLFVLVGQLVITRLL